MRPFKLYSLLALLGFQSITHADINSYLASINTNPNALYVFFKNMPKGGELHYHLAGGAYPEAMLTIAAQGNYCLNKQTWVISQAPDSCQGIKANELVKQPEFYNQVIRAWSMESFVPGQESGHDHFFNTFSKFVPLEANSRPSLLAEIMQRAANQHEQYLEIMVLADNARSINFANGAPTNNNFAALQQQLLSNKGFQDNIKHTVNEVTSILKQARKILGCDKLPNQEVCQLTVKFQHYVLREQPLEKVFVQALNSFAAAAFSKDIVAVNMVQAEDGIISLRDYRKQMQIFNFLHRAYPQVHIALHAGELAPENIAPEDLRFHIADAIHIGQAERIGHGVDIAYEDNAEELLNTMARKSIPVEINLTSNRKILNVFGKNHPLNYYLSHHVPVVLSTDDEGVLRTDLTREYVEAVIHHGLDYPALKMITRNTLTYSFLPGKSLWLNAEKAIPVAACKQLASLSCQEFVKINEKARLQWQLEKKLKNFENSYSDLNQKKETQ